MGWKENPAEEKLSKICINCTFIALSSAIKINKKNVSASFKACKAVGWCLLCSEMLLKHV